MVVEGGEDLKELIEIYKSIVMKVLGKPFPKDPMEQLWGAVSAVFQSWMGKRAISYRRIEGLPDEWGTAVNVQSMVFGNMGDNSATGVAFTRNPATGENYFYGEWLPNAQGEDVVAGIRTPNPINEVGKSEHTEHLPSLETGMPSTYKALNSIQKRLEKHYHDMLDIEFTVQDGKLYMLQTRVGKRTASAALKIAIDMVKERLIDKKTAVLRIDPQQLDQLLHPMIDPKADVKVIAKGLPASPGAAVGKAVFTAEEAENAASRGEKVILVGSALMTTSMLGQKDLMDRLREEKLRDSVKCMFGGAPVSEGWIEEIGADATAENAAEAAKVALNIMK